VPHFQLVLPDGEALGATKLGRPDWPDGSIIDRGAGEPDLRVVDRIEPGADELFTVLVVEPVE
jgi:hypothetical protein